MNNSQKRIAFCFYGQPRNYKKGHDAVNEFLEKNKSIKFDFFFHAWKIPSQTSYHHVPHRQKTDQELYVSDSEEIIEDLVYYYQPISYEYENSKEFNIHQHQESLIYLNSMDIKRGQMETYKHELQALYSQTYSKNKVRKMLLNHIQNTNQQYDSVIITRFDCYEPFSIQYHIESLDLSKSYVIGMHYPRLITPDNFIISPPEVFLKWFDMYENFTNLVDNHELYEYYKKINEIYYLNGEVITLANYLYHFRDLSNICYL